MYNVYIKKLSVTLFISLSNQFLKIFVHEWENERAQEFLNISIFWLIQLGFKLNSLNETKFRRKRVILKALRSDDGYKKKGWMIIVYLASNVMFCSTCIIIAQKNILCYDISKSISSKLSITENYLQPLPNIEYLYFWV